MAMWWKITKQHYHISVENINDRYIVSVESEVSINQNIFFNAHQLIFFL